MITDHQVIIGRERYCVRLYRFCLFFFLLLFFFLSTRHMAYYSFDLVSVFLSESSGSYFFFFRLLNCFLFC